MPSRFKNRHKGRNHTHAVKPDSITPALRKTPVIKSRTTPAQASAAAAKENAATDAA
jgi:hypothetical protein